MKTEPRYSLDFTSLPLRGEPRVDRLASAAPAGAPEVKLDRNFLLNNNIFSFETMDERAQPFVLLRSQVLRRLAPGGGRIVAVTSTQPRNGKSFVAANLAAALSQIQPTFLVDLDLRRPTVRDRFGLPACAGAEDYLRGRQRLAEVGCRVGERLRLLPVREALDNSADLLASPRGTTLFEELRATPGAPVCIIDTPPILEADEMMIIARHVDGVLLVVEEGRTRSEDLTEALRMLHPTPLLGTILNRSVARTVSSSYYSYSGYRSDAGYRRSVEPAIHDAAPYDIHGGRE